MTNSEIENALIDKIIKMYVPDGNPEVWLHKIQKLHSENAQVKTAKMTFSSVKDSDGWMELIHELKFEQFKNEHPEMDEDELSDKFYTEVVSKTFKNGEYGSFEIIVDENFNIIGGRIFK